MNSCLLSIACLQKAGFILHDFKGFSPFLSSQSVTIFIIYLLGFFINCYS